MLYIVLANIPHPDEVPINKSKLFNSDGSCFVIAQKVFEKKYLPQGCLVTDYLVLIDPNMNTLCDRGKVGLICFVVPQKSIFL